MVRPLFSWDKTNPREKALNKNPYNGTLGLYKEADFDPPSKNTWSSNLKDSPKAASFNSRAQFQDEDAFESQQKLLDLSYTPNAVFRDPAVNDLANSFLSKYSAAIGSILNPEEAITADRLAMYFKEQPSAGNAGLFPGRSKGVA